MVYNSVKFDFLIYSIPLGAFISGVIALYQYYILNLERCFYSQMKIQSGDMAMSLGLFSFVIAFHLLDINKTETSGIGNHFWNIWYFSKPAFFC